MRIKLDENIPVRAAKVLEGLGHDADTVAQEGLTGQPDPVIRQAATRDGRLLITQDVGLADVRVAPPGTHPGILLLRIREPSRRQLLARLRSLFEQEDVDSWAGAVLVATDLRLRIRRP